MTNINKEMREAQKLYDKGDYEGASAGFMRACQHYEAKDPTNFELVTIFSNLYSCYISLSKYDEAKSIGFKYIDYGQKTNMKAYTKVGYNFLKSIGSITNDEEMVSKYEDLIEKLEDEEAEKTNTGANEQMQMYTNTQMTKDKALDYAIKMDLDPKKPSEISKGVELGVAKKEAGSLKDKGLLDQAVEMAYKALCAGLDKHGKSEEVAECLKTLGDCVGFIYFYDRSLTKAVEKAELCYESAIKMWEQNADCNKNEYITFLYYCASMMKSIGLNEKGDDITRKAQEQAKKQEEIRKEKERQTDNKIKNLDEEQRHLDQRVLKVEEEQRAIGHSFEELLSKVNMIQSAQTANDDKLKELDKLKSSTTDNDLLKMLLEKERKLQAKQEVLKVISNSQPLLDYFNTLMREIEAVYIGARAVQSGSVEKSESTSFKDAAEFASGFVEMIPFIGKLCSNIVKGVGYTIDKYKNAKNAVALQYIGEVAPSITVFNEFSEVISLKMVQRERSALEAIPGPVDKNLVLDTIKTAVNDGLGGLFEKWIKQAQTKASIKGKSDSGQVIAYLQQGFIKLKPTDNLEEYAEWVLSEKNPKEGGDKTVSATVKGDPNAPNQPATVHKSACCIIF